MKNRIIIYAGQYYDSETGLHYNYHRYYDPKLGRYLRADPIGLEGGVNLYAYGNCNPILNIDPEGKNAGAIIVVGGGVVVAGAIITSHNNNNNDDGGGGLITTVGTPPTFPVPPKPPSACEVACDICTTEDCIGKFKRYLNCTFCAMCIIIPGLF